MPTPFDLQGHRGARGLRPENTLPSFELAFDFGVTTVETDLQLTKDGHVVLCHEPRIDAQLFHPAPTQPVLISQLTLSELRAFRADRNPNPSRFPMQKAEVTRLAYRFCLQRGIEPYGVPTLQDLFDFTEDYAGRVGKQAGKSQEQRERAARVRLDLELKRVPFHPELIGDAFDGQAPGTMETAVVAAVRAAGFATRVNVRSFDHRSVRCLKELAPQLRAAVLVAGTAPLYPTQMARQVGAEVYCPSYEFVDADIVRRAHAGGVSVVPWTINEPEKWERLLALGVDGITTDYPDRLAEWLRQHGRAF